MSKILFAGWSVDVAMDHEREKWRMKEQTHKLTSLISSLNLGSEDMPIEEYVQLAGQEIVDVEYNMIELVDLAWGREIHLGSKYKRRANGGEQCG